jgi:hypothetical protein
MDRYFRPVKLPRDSLNHPSRSTGATTQPDGRQEDHRLEVFNGSAFERRIGPDKPMSFEEFVLRSSTAAGTPASARTRTTTTPPGASPHARTGVFACADRIISVSAKSGDGEAIREIALYSDVVDNGAIGGVVKKVEGGELTFESGLDLADRFFVARVVDASGDIAWSSPIWATKASANQIDMNGLVILKRQLEAAKKHLELVGATSDYGKIHACAVKYLQGVDRDHSTTVYGRRARMPASSQAVQTLS